MTSWIICNYSYNDIAIVIILITFTITIKQWLFVQQLDASFLFVWHFLYSTSQLRSLQWKLCLHLKKCIHLEANFSWVHLSHDLLYYNCVTVTVLETTPAFPHTQCLVLYWSMSLQDTSGMYVYFFGRKSYQFHFLTFSWYVPVITLSLSRSCSVSLCIFLGKAQHHTSL